MKRKLSFIILVLTIMLVACGQPDSQNKTENDENDGDSDKKEASSDADIVLKSSIQTPPEGELTKGFDKFLDEVEERSGGEVAFERYYSESLAKASDSLSALTNNIADIAVFVPSYVPGDIPLANVGNLPALWEDAYVGEAAFHNLYKNTPALQDELETQNVKWVGQYATPSYYFVTSKEVKNIEDIEGKKVIATGGLADLAEALGATVVGTPITESYEAMERGTVDGVFYGLTASNTYDLQEPAKYVYTLPLGSSTGLYGMNLDVWEDLPEEVQNIMEEVAEEHAEDFHEIYQIQGDEAALKEFEEADVEIIEPDEEEIDKLQEYAEPIWNKWAEKNDAQEILDDFRDYLDEAEESNPFDE